MIIYAIFAILMFLSGLIQTSFPVTVNQLEFRADLVLLLVVAITLVRGLREGIVWAFLGGLLLGILSPYVLPLGSYSLMLIVVAVLASLSQSNLFESNLIMPLAIGAIASIVFRIILLLATEGAAFRTAPLSILLRLALPEIIIDVILAPLVYTLVSALDRRLGQQLPVEWQ
jgi:rod shape-determining protein MreD